MPALRGHPRDDFAAVRFDDPAPAAAGRFGSGWAWLIQDGNDLLLVLETGAETAALVWDADAAQADPQDGDGDTIPIGRSPASGPATLPGG